LIKFILKLLVFVVLANAAWRVGSAYLNHYRFEDAVLAAVQYRGTKSDAEMHKKVLELSSQFDVPLADEDLTVRKEQAHTIVEGSYMQPVDLFPGYSHTFPFTLHLDVPTATLP
jgi:hypothetical protein